MLQFLFVCYVPLIMDLSEVKAEGRTFNFGDDIKNDPERLQC